METTIQTPGPETASSRVEPFASDRLARMPEDAFSRGIRSN